MKQHVTPVKKVKDDIENRIEVQKGPIHCAMPTMKFMSRQEKVSEDADHRALKKTGQTNHLHIPKN